MVQGSSLYRTNIDTVALLVTSFDFLEKWFTHLRTMLLILTCLDTGERSYQVGWLWMTVTLLLKR